MHFFPVVYRYPNQECCRKHDCRDGETVCVGEVCQIREDSNDNDCEDHENPVDCRNVNLALVCLRSAYHSQWRERFHVDDLLEETEYSRNHSL